MGQDGDVRQFLVVFGLNIRIYPGIRIYTFFYKKLGSGHSTKSFLISHEILFILVLKVS